MVSSKSLRPLAGLSVAALLALAGHSPFSGGSHAFADAAETASRPAAPASPAGTQDRVRFALAKHVARAEVHLGNVLVANFGEPGSSKYTLNGFQSGLGDMVAMDGTNATLVMGTTAKLMFPADSGAPLDIAIRTRAFIAQPLHVYINGREIPVPRLSGEHFDTVIAHAPQNAFHAGNNSVQIRVDASQTRAPYGRVGMALDWVKLGPAGTSVETFGVTPPTDADLAQTTDGHATLALTDGVTVDYVFDPAAHAHLVTTAKGPVGSYVSVTAHADSGQDVELAHLDASPEGRAQDLPLDAFAGTMTRFRFAAHGGKVLLDNISEITRDGANLAAIQRPKNVVLYLIDTLRADKLSPINPRTRVQTPGLSRFVRDAAVLTNAHSQENWTKPSVATLLTSLMPWQHNALTTEAVLPEAVHLMPELLSEQGFYTGGFVANGYVSDRFGFKQGWDTFRNYIRESRNCAAQFVAADVLEWLDTRPQEKPFFLYVHTIDAHVPYHPPAHFLQMYDPAPYDGPVTFAHNAELLEKVKLGELPLNSRDKVRLEALYDGSITYHDVHFDAIMEGLERRGLANDTMIVVTADHGEEFWDHGAVGHGHSVYEELLHVPMFVKLPGVTREISRVEDWVGLVDVLPTIFEALGVPVPDDAAGHSFLERVRGGSDDAPRVVVSGFMDAWRACALDSWKLVMHGDHAALYDLAHDPHEQHDVAAQHTMIVNEARGLLGLALNESEKNTLAPTTQRPSSNLPQNRAQTHAPAPATAPHRPVVHEQETTTIDAETDAQLRALGYVGNSRR